MTYDFSTPSWSSTETCPHHDAHGFMTPTSQRRVSNPMPQVHCSGTEYSFSSCKRTRLSMTEGHYQERQSVSEKPFAFETGLAYRTGPTTGSEQGPHNDTPASETHKHFISSEEAKCGQKRSRATDDYAGARIGHFVFSIVTGVAGKMWEFCTTVPFAGFKAGPGPSYDMAAGSITSGEGSLRRSSSTIQLPGQFPTDRFAVCDPTFHDTPAANGWILVHNPPHIREEQQSSADSSVAPISSSPRPLHARQSMSRTIPRRRPRMSIPKASSIFSMREEHGNVNRRASLPVVPRSGPGSPGSKISPAGSPEIQKLAARRQRDERRNDASMRKLNQQLQSMIREGREALATKVEVVGEEFDVGDMDEDEGFAED